ncbi:MAG: SDR family NAD(P)-dependent oxidoreductase [Moorea sp. SIO1G6]|uniref:type I polyketide synthase n=2 Tax=unclassified Moorena TaxID=2683338 RepID=UPI0013C17C4B|nr:type I polyketide synthase [Moorena sp. SIO1G6]NET68996.1 SDR family NAD(P)-dependent oxidoreductase [Moorena sp. SIO1G6]
MALHPKTYDEVAQKLSVSFGGSLQLPSNAPRLLCDLLERAALTNRGIIYIQADGSEQYQSYQDLMLDAQRVLAGLRQWGLKPQDKVILQLEQGQDFIPAFWGCVLGGFIPVPVSIAPTYQQLNNVTQKLQNAWQMLEHPPILTNRELAPEIQALSTHLNLEKMQVVVIEALREQDPNQEIYRGQPDDLALLLLTSGSTGLPKGVMLSHGNLLSMSAGTIQMNHFDAQAVTLNWMPLDHVGAIVFLGVMAVDLGCQQVHVPTKYILQNPLHWLALIERYQATISWAPNFAFSLINDLVKDTEIGSWDLSSMTFLVNAGEQIVPKIARTFLALMGRQGLAETVLHPAFGMSETCSGITWSEQFSLSTTSDDMSFVGLGRPIPGAYLRIVNDENEIVPEGVIGKLQVKGASVTRGYYQNPEKNQAAFTADGWFKTGDLGYLENGHLVLTGRDKDEILINGVNYPAHEIEAVVEEVDGVEISFTAACAIQSETNTSSSDQLAVFFSAVEGNVETNPEVIKTLIKKIRGVVVKTLGINPDYILPVSKESIPKTAIGKIQHKQLKQQFEAGEFDALIETVQSMMVHRSQGTTLPKTEVEQLITTIWQNVLGLEEIGGQENFFELGGHSLLLLTLQSQLQQDLGKELSIAQMFRYPTIEALAQYFTQTEPEDLASQRGHARAQIRQQIRGATSSTEIAVIGMAGRFPGADNLDQFWQNLQNGTESITFLSDAELLDSGIDPSLLSHPNYVKANPILSEVEYFDANFFGYSGREAELMDPQQRLLMECAWESLEDAGYNPLTYAGSIGLYAGAMLNTYFVNNLLPNRDKLDSHDDLRVITPDSMGGFQLMIANDKDYLTTRISYKLNLTGPSVNVQTACSTSLVTVHMAAQSLLNGECDLALAGGVSVQVPQRVGHLYQDGLMVSPDGHCRAFDAQAEGTIFGSGIGLVVLKRLEAALTDGDHIYAVIKGSAINNDGGNKVGYAVPNGEGQATAVAEAIATANVNPETITYVETHGTGTLLGDPIEFGGLSQAFQGKTDRKQFCAIGSVKTNVGHLQITSGIAGFIKTVLALYHKQLPPSLHFETPNPKIDFDNSPFFVNTTLSEWNTNGQPRRAGVNSLGIGGTNAHVVLEEAPENEKRKTKNENGDGIEERSHHILTLSAKTASALQGLVNRYHNYLNANTEVEIADICYTTHVGRAHFDHRLGIVSESSTDLHQKLASVLNDDGEFNPELVPGCYQGQTHGSARSQIAFLFTGQGAQYVNMGRELYQTQSVFRSAIDQCDQILRSELDSSLLDILYPQKTDEQGSSLLEETGYTQPALFAIEYALAQLWQSWGIEPTVVMGHSVGEYVAATIAGVFSLETGLKLIAARGKLMQQLSARGVMVSVMASEEQVRSLISPDAEKVSIAAINGPESIVISGDSEAIAAICSKLEALGVKTKPLQVSHAFHSPLMKPMVAEFETVAKEITYSQPQIPLISNVTGKQVGEEITSAEYWVNHVRQPVQFAQSMKTLHQKGYEIFLEIGPKPILLAMGSQCVPEGIGVWLPSLRPGVDEWQQMLSSLGQLYVQGVKVDWSGLDRDYSRNKVVLPTYPFQRERYWIETKENGYQKNGSLISDSNTAIVNLLSQGATDALAQQLEQSANFSPEQLKLLPEILEVLAKKHQRQLAAATIKDWFYQLHWKPLPQTQPQTSIQPSHWLIFADTTGVAEKLAQKLQQQGNECSLVYRADNYQKQSAGKYQINPCAPQEFEQLYKAILETSQLQLSKVIHLWSLDAPDTQDLTLNALEQTQLSGCGSVLNLLQTVLKTTSIPQLWLVTRGAQSVLSRTEKLAVAASPLWGLGRVVSLENPQLWGGLVDLDLQTSEYEVERLLQLLVNNSEEDYIALRGEKTYVARLVKQSPQASSQPLSLSSDATYLITGGLGALGLHTAQWLVEKGATNIVLTGRSAPSATAQEIIDQLEQARCQVSVLLGDISVEQDVAQIIQQIQTSLPTLKGVIHAAGVLDDATLQQMSWDNFAKVIAPKVTGTWHLHQFTQHLPLDFFVCFSSMASLIGSPGQGNYAAANTFMDAIAHYRRAIGLSGLSINWGPWSSGGMAARLGAQHQNRIDTSGISDIAPEQGMYALEELLGNQSLIEQVGVISVKWSLLAQQWSNINNSSLLRELLQKEELQEQQVLKQKADREILEKLETASEGERQEILREYIRGQVAQVLGLSSSQLPEMNLGFMEMGMDSLTTVELKNRLQAQLGTALPGTVAMEYPTIETLSQYILKEVMGWQSVADSENNLAELEEVDVDDQILPVIENISEEEFEALAAQQLEKIKSML